MTIASNQTIAVFGATGNQGGSVVNALLDRGATVRALVRDPESAKAQSLAERGVELAAADAADPASLAQAIKGADAFFYMTMPPGGMRNADTAGETAQGIALADAAAQAQVPRIVYSSVGGADRGSGIPHFESKRRVEEYLQELNLPVTFIRPVFFIENFVFMGPSLEDDEIVVRLPMPDGIALQMVAVRDIGKAAAAALLGTPIHGGAVEIAGDARTGSEIAAAFGEHAGKKARYEALPLQVLDGQDDMQKMFRWFAETPAYQADLGTTRRLVPELLDLPAWLQANDWTPRA